MLYCGKKITSLMRGRYLIHLWFVKTFGNAESRRINPETGENDPNGVWVESDRDCAAQELYYCMHGSCADETGHYDKDFLNDRIWWNLATPEESNQRCLMETADEDMRRNM